MLAAVLLLWTAVDLVYCHVCVPHDASIPTDASPSLSGASADHATTGQDDHCFCCSHRVTVTAGFAGARQHPIATVEALDSVLAPKLNVLPIYHPPLV